MSAPKINAIQCEEALKRLFAYLDHELHGRRHEEMDRHLKTCRSCFSRAEFERRLKTQLAEVGQEKAPANLEQRIFALLKDF